MPHKKSLDVQFKGDQWSFHSRHLTTLYTNHMLAKIETLKRCCLGLYTLYYQQLYEKNGKFCS